MEFPQLPKSWKIGLQSAGYLSALCLVVIQVGIGIIMKSSQTGGKYAFSSSGLVTISEFLKLLLSTSLLLRQCLRSSKQHSGESGPRYAPLIPLTSPSRNKLIPKEHYDEETGSDKISREGFDVGLEDYYPKPTLFRLFLACLKEVSVDSSYGFANLALLYALINNTIFVSYKLADPGTIAITRSGLIFITAFVMVTTLRTRISSVQWIAIAIQLCGLITTQYRPEVGTSYPYSTYIVLLFQVFVSAVAGVYNESLLKCDHASLHAQNTLLYAFGVVINSMIHTTMRIIKPEEPNLFAGYTNLASYLVILSNVFIGLAITAVYKYADAVIKCLATAVATGILLFVSPIIFDTSMTPLTIPGSLIVFISSWLYVKSPAEKSTDEKAPARSLGKKFSKYLPSLPALRMIMLPVVTVLTILIITLLETVTFPDHATAAVMPTLPPTSVIHSPFNTTMGYIKWNHYHVERIPLLQKYEPFFHTTHYSMPLPDEKDSEVHNLTNDAWQNPLVNYFQIAKTMQFILDQSSNSSAAEITGLLFIHFDAWIDPLDFYEDDFEKMWIAYTQAYGGPRYICGTDRGQFAGWVGLNSDRNWHYPIIEAQLEIEKANASYIFNPREFCIGWSDIYYIPRHLFADYIYLSTFFAAQNAFHELVIPSIMHIIDQTRRKHEFNSIINFMAHCYGGCCAGGADMNQLMSHRCGHKLDYLGNQTVINAHYERLDQEAARLGMEIEDVQVERYQNFSSFGKSLSSTAKAAYEEVLVRPPPNHWVWTQTDFAFNQTGLEPPLDPVK